jgi:hypothetical protein
MMWPKVIQSAFEWPLRHPESFVVDGGFGLYVGSRLELTLEAMAPVRQEMRLTT